MRKWFCRFIVGSVDSAGVMLLFGPKRTPTDFPWHVLEGVVDYLKGRGWIPVGAPLCSWLVPRCLRTQASDWADSAPMPRT